MQRLSRTFPPGLSDQFTFDTTEAVEESVKEGLITLAIAIGSFSFGSGAANV